VCGLFTMIVRLADSFGWEVPDWQTLLGRAQAMHDGGYSLGAMGRR